MKIKREWRDEPEVFEAVAELDRSESIEVDVRDEVGNYGDEGMVIIKLNGRKFLLELHEVV